MSTSTGPVAARLNNAILSRPVLSTVLAGLLILLAAQSVAAVHPLGDVDWNWWSIGLLAMSAYGLAVTLLWFRLPTVTQGRDELVLLSWTFAVAPSLMAFGVAALERVHLWAFLAAISMSIGGVALATFLAVRSREAVSQEPL